MMKEEFADDAKMTSATRVEERVPSVPIGGGEIDSVRDEEIKERDVSRPTRDQEGRVGVFVLAVDVDSKGEEMRDSVEVSKAARLCQALLGGGGRVRTGQGQQSVDHVKERDLWLVLRREEGSGKHRGEGEGDGGAQDGDVCVEDEKMKSEEERVRGKRGRVVERLGVIAIGWRGGLCVWKGGRKRKSVWNGDTFTPTHPLRHLVERASCLECGG